MVICLQQGADLHTAQLMPLPLRVSCFSKIQIGCTFLVPDHQGSPGKRAVKQICVCVCVYSAIQPRRLQVCSIKSIVSCHENFIINDSNYSRKAIIDITLCSRPGAAPRWVSVGHISQPQQRSRTVKVGKLTRVNMSLTLSCKLVEVFTMICAVLLQNQAQDSVVL